MLNKIKQLGLEKFAGDAVMANAFVQGFTRQALTKQAFDLSEFNKGVGGAIGKGLGATAMGAGLHVLNKAVNSVQMGGLHNQFMSSLEHAVATNPVLKQADHERVLNYAETVFKFAPHVATDANLLSSILANAVHGDGIDPMTIRTLTDLDGKYMENHSSTFSPKTYV